MPLRGLGGLTAFTSADKDEDKHDTSAISEGEEEFESRPVTETIKRRLSGVNRPEEIAKFQAWQSLTPMYIGIAGQALADCYEVGLSIHDSVYSTDFAVKRIHFPNNEVNPTEISNYVIDQITAYSKEHLMKFVGAGVTEQLVDRVPGICARLWKELDIVPIVFHVRSTHRLHARAQNKTDAQGFPLTPGTSTPQNPLAKAGEAVSTTIAGSLAVAATKSAAESKFPTHRAVDEQADSAVRKAVLYFGPSGHNPRLLIGYRNEVDVDCGGRVHIVDSLEDYRASVREPTWNAVMHYAKVLKEKNIRFAFFSSTPQGGGVALMRHALIRLFRLLGVQANWYIPSPSPAVFRITKNNHNILQGVSDPNLRFTQAQQDQFTQWINYNAERYWLSEGGPLAAGGADVIFIDDPQMPGLIPLIKKLRPEVPVIYRSHIEIRSELTHIAGSSQEDVWNYLWSRIKEADLFISHPVATFIPDSVPVEKVALLPATTDWLDGLSKPLSRWDIQYYMGIFRTSCNELRMNKLHWPNRQYICQVARFDPAKGIPEVIQSYWRLRELLDRERLAAAEIPQLLICGHGAIDDPDASIIYSQTLEMLEDPNYSHYSSDIVVMRIPPSDQILNTLMSSAKVILQLSTREGFEVKVSEAIHKGKPIIATRAGGIPLQVQHEKNGYLVSLDPKTGKAVVDEVAKRLRDLWVDNALYKKMAKHAADSVSDEVGTWGNAAAWMYLAAKFGSGEKLQPNGRWLNDMLREDCGEPYKEDEPRLPRNTIILKKAKE